MRVIGGCLMMPLKKPASKGAVPVMKEKEFPFGEYPDLVDEALQYFRANVLFKSFTIDGPADRVIVYLTLFTGLCLRTIAKCKSADEADKAMQSLKGSKFALPGEPGWPLGTMFPKPEKDEESEFRRYLKQLRETVIARLPAYVFFEDGTPNKFWMAFAKKSFMKIDLSA